MTTQTKKHTILVVDDEISLLNALSHKLVGADYTMLGAKNGQEGLDTALRDHPDLILLDIVMPVMDGITMLTKLREDAWGKDVQVIMLTNLSEKEKVSEAMLQGSYDYIVKSDWKIDEIIAKVKEKLRV